MSGPPESLALLPTAREAEKHPTVYGSRRLRQAEKGHIRLGEMSDSCLRWSVQSKSRIQRGEKSRSGSDWMMHIMHLRNFRSEPSIHWRLVDFSQFGMPS